MPQRRWPTLALALAVATGIGAVGFALRPSPSSSAQPAAPSGDHELIISFLYPTDGDSYRDARRRIETAVVKADSASKMACVHRRGFRGYDWLPVVQGVEHLHGIAGDLPALRDIASGGLVRAETARLAGVPPAVVDAFARCDGKGRKDVTRFESKTSAVAGSYWTAIRTELAKAVQQGEWDAPRQCFRDLGAPSTSVLGPTDALNWAISRANTSYHGLPPDELLRRQAAGEPLEPDGGAFARKVSDCLQPFYDTFDDRLQELRQAEIERQPEAHVEIEALYQSIVRGGPA